MEGLGRGGASDGEVREKEVDSLKLKGKSDTGRAGTVEVFHVTSRQLQEKSELDGERAVLALAFPRYKLHPRRASVRHPCGYLFGA